MNLADSPLLKLESSFEATALIRLDFVLTQLALPHHSRQQSLPTPSAASTACRLTSTSPLLEGWR